MPEGFRIEDLLPRGGRELRRWVEEEGGERARDNVDAQMEKILKRLEELRKEIEDLKDDAEKDDDDDAPRAKRRERKPVDA